MAIDNLNFKLVVDDAAFNKQITDAINKAKDMNTQVSKYLSSFSSMSGITLPDFSKMQQHAASLLATMNQVKESIKEMKADLKDATTAMREFRDATKSADSAMGKLKTSVKNSADNSSKLAKSMQTVDRAVTNADNKMQNFTKSSKTAANAMASMGMVVGQQRTSLNGLTSALTRYLNLWMGFRFVKNIAEVTGEFEKQRVSLENILQDVSGADKIFNQIRDFAVKSPFQFSELTDYVKQLSAFSVPMEDLFDTTKMLADVSAGLGVDMNRIVLAYGQIRSAAFLRGQEVRQLTEAGIPILAELSKQIEQLEGHAVSAAQVFDKISTRQISFEMVEKVFKDMTSEGGKFYKMQEVQAETLAGKISNLKDAWKIMLDNFGKANDSLLRGGINGITNAMRNYNALGKAIVSIAVTVGSYKLVNTMYSFGESIIKASQKANKAVGAFSKTKVFFKSMGTTLLGVSVALGALIGTKIIQAIKNAGRLKKELGELSQVKLTDLNKELDTIDGLVEAMGKMNKGSKEYSDAIDRLNRQYGDYLENLVTEADSYDAIKTAAIGASEAIKKKYQEDAYVQGMAKIEEKYSSDVAAIRGTLLDVLTGDPALRMGEDAAASFLEAFKRKIEENSDKKMFAASLFVDTYNEFFASSDNINSQRMEELADDYLTKLTQLGKIYQRQAKETKLLRKTIHDTFLDSTYSTAEEYEMIEKIKADYAKIRDDIESNYSSEEAPLKIKEANIAELKSMLSVYMELGRFDKIKEINAKLAKLTKEETGWQKLVNETLSVFSDAQKNKFKVDETSNYLDFIEKIRKSYKSLGQDIADTPKDVDESVDDMREGLEEEKDAIEAIAKALHISLKEIEKTSSSADPYAAQKKELKQRIAHIKQLMSEYESFTNKGISDESAKGILSLFYPDDSDLIQSGKFADAINKCADALERFNDAEGADSARLNIGKSKSEQYLDSFNNLEKLRDKLMDWIKKDLELSGNGLELDIQKIFKDLSAKNLDTDLNIKQTKLLFEEAKKDEQALEQVREKYGEEAWLAYLNKGVDALDELAEREKKNNLLLAQEKINSLATAYLKEQKQLGNLDTGSLSKRTISQLTELRDKILALAKDENRELSEDLQKEASKLGISFEVLQQNIQKVLEGKYNETTREMFKRLKKSAEEVLDAVGQIGGHIADMGESAGNVAVQDLGILIEKMSQVAEIVLDCESLFDLFSKKASSMVEEVSGVISETAENMGSLAESTGEAAEASEDFSDSVDNIAKSSDWITMIIKLVLMFVEGIADAVTGANQLKTALKEAAEEMRVLNEEAKLTNNVDSIFGTNSLQSIRNATSSLKDFGKAAREDIKYAKSIAGEFTFKNGLFNLYTAHGSIGEVADKLGADIYDEYGNLNADTLQKILDTYDTLTKGSREWIQKAIDDSTLYKEAMEQLAEYMSDIFSSLASEIADSMVSAFKQTGDAVSDLEDIFMGMGETLTKSILESLVLENVLNEYKDEMLGAAKQYGKDNDETAMMQTVSDIMGKMQDDLASQAEVYNAILQYADNLGWLQSSEEDGLSNGIQGITEETANLLASYLNAIRADVSVGRAQWMQIASDIREMMGLIGSVPNIGEYLAQIQANTYDTAVASRSILNELKSVITSEGGALAFRTLGY